MRPDSVDMRRTNMVSFGVHQRNAGASEDGANMIRSNRLTLGAESTPLSCDLCTSHKQLDAIRRLISQTLVARMPREGLAEVVEYLLDAHAFYTENRRLPAPSRPKTVTTEAVVSGRVSRPTLDLR